MPSLNIFFGESQWQRHDSVWSEVHAKDYISYTIAKRQWLGHLRHRTCSSHCLRLFFVLILAITKMSFSKLYLYSLSYRNTTILIHHISEIYHWLCLLWPLFGTTTDVPYGPKCLRYTPPSPSLSLYSLRATETVCWLLYHCFKLIWPLCHYCRLPSHFNGLLE
jgi:hypothetical protein